jgi:hypothetical protein
MIYRHILAAGLMAFAAVGCAHRQIEKIASPEAARLDQELVKETVVFEPGTEEGAVIPEISAPRLRARKVPEKIEGGKLVEAHREWLLEGDVVILGIPEINAKPVRGKP